MPHPPSRNRANPHRQGLPSSQEIPISVLLPPLPAMPPGLQVGITGAAPAPGVALSRDWKHDAGLADRSSLYQQWVARGTPPACPEPRLEGLLARLVQVLWLRPCGAAPVQKAKNCSGLSLSLGLSPSYFLNSLNSLDRVQVLQLSYSFRGLVPRHLAEAMATRKPRAPGTHWECHHSNQGQEALSLR